MSFIDVEFDFTSDTKDYWKDYWTGDPLLGCVNQDPDCASKTMQLYHKIPDVWNRLQIRLTNGMRMVM